VLTTLSAAVGPGSLATTIISAVATMLFLGFLMTRVTKQLRLPNVSAYIITGILIGPFCLNLIPAGIIEGMDFLSDIALAFIAFSTGEFFRLEVLKKNGMKVAIIAIMEALVSSVLVFILTFFILRLNLAFSIVVSALASATASTSTMMTIRQTRAKGDFVNTLLLVIAVDNIIALLAYSMSISIATNMLSGAKLNPEDILMPVLTNLFVMALGYVFGVFLRVMIGEKRSSDNRLIIAIAFLFAFCGVCTILNISPLLGCMTMGMTYINLGGEDKLFKQINYFSPPFMLLYFVRSGLNFDMSALFDSSSIGSAPLLLIGILYFVVRIIGKFAGSYTGCLMVGKDKSVRNYLGMALVPQAGVAIGLAALGARALGGEMGDALQTIILSSSILYELVGPACAKASLYLSKSYSNNLEELVQVEEKKADGEQKSSLDMLIERIQKIQQEMPVHTEETEEEQAFTHAAEEYEMAPARRMRPGRR
jgi:Kef-type K+ transport system membrane component KefB